MTSLRARLALALAPAGASAADVGVVGFGSAGGGGSEPGSAPSTGTASAPAVTLFGALKEEAAVRAEAQMRAGQFVSACTIVCACIALARDATLALSTLILAIVVFAFFTTGRLARGPVKTAVQAAAPAVALSVPAILITVIAKSLDIETAFTTWLAPGIIAFLITMSVLRLEPWRPIVYATVSSVLYLAAYAVATWEMTWAQRDASVALVPYAQVIRVIFFIGSGVGLSLVSQAMRDAIERAEKKTRARVLFGKYKLGKPIASGGMASVVEALYCPEGGFERPVAIKRVHPHLARDPHTVELFRREAELGACLAHPNIVSVLDFGRIDDTYFIAMEHVAGIDLRRLLTRMRKRGDALPPALAAFIAMEALQGLGFAHGIARDRQGRLLRVVHRDLSPANVLLSMTGDVKVTDFGIATTLRGEQLHHSRRIVGSMAYLSPEQAAQSAFDHRADLFAIAAVLYEMLTSKRLFKRPTTAATLLAVIHDSAPALPDWLPNHRAWDRFFKKALAKDPDERFRTAKEMAAGVALAAGDDVAQSDDLASFLAEYATGGSALRAPSSDGGRFGDSGPLPAGGAGQHVTQAHPPPSREPAAIAAAVAAAAGTSVPTPDTPVVPRPAKRAESLLPMREPPGRQPRKWRASSAEDDTAPGGNRKAPGPTPGRGNARAVPLDVSLGDASPDGASASLLIVHPLVSADAARNVFSTSGASAASQSQSQSTAASASQSQSAANASDPNATAANPPSPGSASGASVFDAVDDDASSPFSGDDDGDMEFDDFDTDVADRDTLVFAKARVKERVA